MDHLEKIIADVRKTLQSGHYRVPSQDSQRMRPSLCEAIERRRGRAVIAELKPASPVSGPLIRDRSPAEILKLYTQSEIVGLSVLTEPVHFGGSLELLAQASATGLPTLMKDFIIAPEQIVAGALCGASAVLLIVTLFQRRWTSMTLEEAIALAHEHGLEVLAEVASAEEFLVAQQTDADMIGINNRDLTTLKIDTDRTVEILKKVRKDRPVWSLSGIETAQDMQRLSAAGADAFLIGTALMQAADPATRLRELLSQPPSPLLALTPDPSPVGELRERGATGGVRALGAEGRKEKGEGRVKVKICGIRFEGDIEAAQCADALGFIVGTPQSPRNLTLTRARTLMKRVPPSLTKVVVTVASDLEQIISLGEALAPDALHVHNTMSPQELAQLRALLPKELRIYGLVPVIGSAEELIVRGRALAQAGLDGVILDTLVGRRVGGTGRVHDWAVSRIVRDALHPLTVILAGGLTPENVRRALEEVRPEIVDVASGVEEADGRKSREKIEALIRQVRSYESDSANQSQTE